ncbi:neutral zinc metallopeptidase [Pseudomonas sp. PCH199]|uniref:KPN_02809 family neutral zinc metallopeptidase n=1 Tax=unclassified Pseudomonas TaxID=196821 RepID=UPI000BCF49A0|nr:MULTISPECIES: neutral zinc metallopeptidase [unclassified Pseudomonas]MCW8275877.1 neutral zinc metallopeptidase [Pseudomonas sp. PCH199]PAM83951.1 metalloprotease [Pseudomonas sp. ERMR1:02]
MLWNKARRSDNVNDTREGKDARTLTGKTLGAGLAAIALASAGFYSLLSDSPVAPSDIHEPPASPLTIEPTEDLQLKFVQSVLGETEDTWKQLFAQSGREYAPPTLTLFDKGIVSECGFANPANAPFYCPSNQQVYLDLAVFEKLEQHFSVVADFARAYIIAHEIGHHVQLELDLSDPFEKALLDQQPVMGDGGLEVRAELQADCLAGVWAHHAQQRLDWLEPGDIEAALHAAAVFGDDNLQRSRNSAVRPETFSHGTSEQRVNWFKTGFDTGRTQACDTFAAIDL